MFEGKYTELPDSSPIPLMQLQIRQSESIPSISSQGILDTGADCTLVPFSISVQLPSALTILSVIFLDYFGERSCDRQLYCFNFAPQDNLPK